MSEKQSLIPMSKSTNSIFKTPEIPTQPGVYLFKDREDKILYIGKAKNLRNRVRTYFQESSKKSPKIISLISNVNHVEWIVTENEVEALLTEANLIKEYKPKYNISLKDDKSFPYIEITKEPFPQVLLTRKVSKNRSKYFGPYTEVKSLRNTLKVIHKVFPVRSCNYFLDDEVISKKKISICLDYHIKKCEGPCEGFISKEKYNQMIQDVIQFLHGRTEGTIREIRKKMEQASNEMRYEEAALYRDQIHSITSFSKRQRKVMTTFDDKDIIAVVIEENDACAVVIRLRNGKIIGREKVFLSGTDTYQLNKTISEFIHQFYLETDFIPNEIILQELPNDNEFLSQWLSEKRGKRVKLKVPHRGEKARLLRMCMKNAELLLGEYIRKKERRRELVPTLVKQLQADLRLAVPPRRIEAFDISNIQGTNPVGSMVCFVDGKPRKREYRYYKIKSVKGIDDFAMIREIVFRRYSRLKSDKASFPDLILIDGGKGQLNMAVSALRELGLTYLPIIGLAKRLEEVFLPGFSDPQSILKSSPGLILLRRIRDEAHRFAISFHRKIRNKEMKYSIFREIPGVGPITCKKLLTSFNNVGNIASCSSGQLASKIHVSKKVAKKIIKKAIAFQSVKKN